MKAYQAVKHNRAKNLKKGNLKHLIRALGGLYILNIYYRETIFDLGNDEKGTSFDTSLGSELFSVKFHVSNELIMHKEDFIIDTGKNLDYEECIYLIKITDKER